MRVLGLLACILFVWPAAGANYTTYSIFDFQQQAPPYGNAYDTAPGSVSSIGGVLLTDSAGNVYTGASQIWKIAPDGTMTPFAGFGSAVLYPGDRTPAILAGPLYSTAAAIDGSGDVFIAGEANGTTQASLYRVTPDGLISLYIIVPTSWPGISGLSVDANGNVYVLVGSPKTTTTGELVKIAPDLTITTIAQISGLAGWLYGTAMAGDSAGNQYVAEFAGNQVVKINGSGAVSTVAQVTGPMGIARDPQGNIYVSQPNLGMVEKIAANGTVTPLAGNGSGVYSGDGGTATQAGLLQPVDVAVDASGNVYIGDGGRLRKVDASAIIHTFAGCGCGGDDVPATWAKVGGPLGVATDLAGNVYFADQGANMVRKIAPSGDITTVAGNGEAGFSGDGGQATQARLWAPAGLALDASGNLYIADEQNNRIRKVTVNGLIQTVAGSGVSGFGGDGGQATQALLGSPDGVAVDTAGNIYIADTATHRIRKVTPDGTIHTIAGSDQAGLAGDGGPASAALLYNPRMLVLDNAGDLLFTDTAENVVRMITPLGTIQRVAGTGVSGYSGDGGPATAAELGAPWGLALDAQGDILIGDMSAGGRIRAVGPTKIINTLTPALAKGLGVDSSGRIWWGNGGNTSGGNLLVATQNGLPFTPAPVIFDSGVTGAAMPDTAAVAPGEIVSIFGDHLGPATAANASVSGGKIGTMLAGVQVFFNSTPAPVLYASTGQINAVVPFEVAGATAAITVQYNGATSNVQTLQVALAAPQLFLAPQGTLQTAAALNADGSLNTAVNPAVAGSIVTLWGTGAGAMNPAQQDGLITTTALATPALTTGVTAAAQPWPVPYAGAAPDIVAGGIQLNVQLPQNVLTGYYSLELRSGNAISGPAIVFTQAKQ